MTTLNETITRTPVAADQTRVVLQADFTAEADATSFVALTGAVQYQYEGPVAAATLALECSTLDPSAGGGNPVEVADFTAAAAGGAEVFQGAGTAWYRIQNKATFGPASDVLNRTLASVAAAINGLQAFPIHDFAPGTDDVPTVHAEVTDAGELTVTAITPGVAGNAITTTFTAAGMGDGAWGAATLENGAAAVAATGTLTFSAVAAANDTVTVGGQVYEFLNAFTGGAANRVLRGGSAAASRNNLLAAINRTGTSATGTLTLAANAANGDTVTIRNPDYVTVYTFKTALTSPVSPFEVLIGASASDSIDNLIAAINSGSGAGTAYGSGTPPNPLITAAAGAGDTMTATAKRIGSYGDSVVTRETGANMAWGASALSGSTGPGVEYGESTVANASVTAAANGGAALDVTAITAGVAGNSVDTTETGAQMAWGAATLTSGADAVAASGVFTSTDDLEEDDEMVVGTVTYTFKDALTPTAGEVMVASTKATVTLSGTYAGNN